MIGKKIVFEKDTLRVIDYSFFNSTYSLSNGVEVNVKLIDSTLIIK